jgi:hypothetical protein
MSMISEALRTVHSVATSVSASREISPGGALPTVPVKEGAADKPAPFSFPAGKHIIVRLLSESSTLTNA